MYLPSSTMEALFLHCQATILLSQLGGIKHWRYRLLVYSVGPILIFVWLGSKKAKMCNGKDAFAIKPPANTLNVASSKKDTFFIPFWPSASTTMGRVVFY